MCVQQGLLCGPVLATLQGTPVHLPFMGALVLCQVGAVLGAEATAAFEFFLVRMNSLKLKDIIIKD